MKTFFVTLGLTALLISCKPETKEKIDDAKDAVTEEMTTSIDSAKIKAEEELDTLKNKAKAKLDSVKIKGANKMVEAAKKLKESAK